MRYTNSSLAQNIGQSTQRTRQAPSIFRVASENFSAQASAEPSYNAEEPRGSLLNEELAAGEKIPDAADPILSQSAGEAESVKEPKSSKEKYSAKKAEKMKRRLLPH